jgi:hypothetical protein
MRETARRDRLDVGIITDVVSLALWLLYFCDVFLLFLPSFCLNDLIVSHIVQCFLLSVWDDLDEGGGEKERGRCTLFLRKKRIAKITSLIPRNRRIEKDGMHRKREETATFWWPVFWCFTGFLKLMILLVLPSSRTVKFFVQCMQFVQFILIWMA